MGLAGERVVVRVQLGNKIRLRLTKLTEVALPTWGHIVCTLGSHLTGVIEKKHILDVLANSAFKLSHFDQGLDEVIRLSSGEEGLVGTIAGILDPRPDLSPLTSELG